MPGISQKMLSVALRSLVRGGLNLPGTDHEIHHGRFGTFGLAARRMEACVPPAAHHRLTGLGLSLERPLAPLRAWTEQHMAQIEEMSCGTTPHLTVRQAERA